VTPDLTLRTSATNK